jgi:sigma-B regulation protein RsbU (phosphoserine phosphatase)
LCRESCGMTTYSVGKSGQGGPVAAGQAVARGGRPAPVRAGSPDEIRQLAVDRLMLVGTPPEERFDRLTRLAQTAFGVPVAAITLLDHDRIWTKSCAGMPGADTPRLKSFCNRTVALGKLIVVKDARRDERFAGLPTVAGEPGFRFYAGFPIADPDGIVVGTFCLLSFEPRTLDAREVELLTELAAWAGEEMTGSADTERAREVQQRMLPACPPGLDGYEVAAFCVPALSVGGDYYDYTISSDAFRFCVADVMGKGSGAAIIAATVRAAMRAAWSPGVRDRRREARWTPGEVLTHANRTLQGDLDETGALVTVLAASIDGPSGQVTYADAGHGLTVIAGGDRPVQWLESAGLPLGVDHDIDFPDHQAQLGIGDTLLCFTDGLLDLYGGGREALNRIGGLVRERPDPGDLTGYIRQLAVSGMPGDDVTAIAMRRMPAT